VTTAVGALAGRGPRQVRGVPGRLPRKQGKEGKAVSKWRIGDVTVTKVIELEVTGGSRFLLPQATPDAIKPIAWLRPHFADENGRLRMSIHTFLVETPDRRIVVDTCLGNDKENRHIPHWNNMQTRFLSDIAEAGYPRESIDTVLCTHLHVDHVGWNTMKVGDHWVPTFPNARYLMGRTEYAHWSTVSDRPDMHFILADSVTPILKAGLADLVETDHRLCPEISLIPTVGHTPGHVSVRISSGGEEALITGDFMHHPCQIAQPEWSTNADSDRDRGIRTRLDMFERLAGTPTLVIGTHFAGATAGRIVRDGDAFRLDVP
jgi:glyoxylase-like metal-dependent hydrolase (beta-lactamase superfamily II)